MLHTLLTTSLTKSSGLYSKCSNGERMKEKSLSVLAALKKYMKKIPPGIDQYQNPCVLILHEFTKLPFKKKEWISLYIHILPHIKHEGHNMLQYHLYPDSAASFVSNVYYQGNASTGDFWIYLHDMFYGDSVEDVCVWWIPQWSIFATITLIIFTVIFLLYHICQEMEKDLEMFEGFEGTLVFLYKRGFYLKEYLWSGSFTFYETILFI
ncbi:hypothetical protein ACJX0J_020923 [Zea mays]